MFIENNDSSIMNLKKVLLLFQVITGLSINFSKSSIYHVSNERSSALTGLEILGCQFDKLPFKYLGAWVGMEKKSCAAWSNLKENMMSKFGGWKCSYLNMAGRMELLKSNLNSIPNYWFSLQLIPKTTCRELEEIRRKFFWGQMPNQYGTRKMHSIKWKTICSRKEAGGLSITRLDQKNVVLLAKWWWKFWSDRDRKWLRFIVNKYGYKFIYDEDEPPKNMSMMFKDMWYCRKNDQVQQWISNKMFKWKLGNGYHIQFWEDWW